VNLFVSNYPICANYCLQDLLWRSRKRYAENFSQYGGGYYSAPCLRSNSLPSGQFHQAAKLSAEIDAFSSTVHYLDERGAFSSDLSLKSEALGFIRNMETIIKQREAMEDKSIKKSQNDVSNPEGVAMAIKDAVKRHYGLRHLVHVLDVQKSVARDLASKDEKRWTTAVDQYASNLHMWSRSMRKKSHNGELGNEEEQYVRDIAQSMSYASFLVSRELDA
jgi:hypothetical protein